MLSLVIGGEAFLVWFLLRLRGERRRPQASRGENRARRPYLIKGNSAALRRVSVVAFIFITLLSVAGRAQEPAAAADEQTQQPPAAPAPAAAPPADDSGQTWQYGGFIDAGYLHDFNYPDNQLFRSRGTTFHVNEPVVDMAAVYVRKLATEKSRWGMELTLQAGKDSQLFGYSATAPNLDGSEVLRHFGPTDVSYLAPIGKGLTIQGGIFSSLIGYDSLYAKDNFNYTRPWGADFTPYLMLGVNASYPVTPKVTLTGFVVNGYWHLADANAVPSFGGQVAYKPTGQWTLKETVLIGPHQADTSLEFWRVITDTIVEYKRDRFTVAFDFMGATEQVAPAGPRAAWVAAQLPTHWQFDKHWALAVRPEVTWDSDGRWTGSAQTVKAVTTTIEYRVPVGKANAIFRLEHRIDDSHGPQGGFFDDGTIAPGVPHLKPTQNLLIFGAIFTFDGTFHHK
jgi:hypothetical protein